ncbi:MAG: DUF971 domain-containing protein [Acidobacteriia bacterium]|nr:DUF971 domain-containing protein [Terriglobia bacterium]
MIRRPTAKSFKKSPGHWPRRSALRISRRRRKSVSSKKAVSIQPSAFGADRGIADGRLVIADGSKCQSLPRKSDSLPAATRSPSSGRTATSALTPTSTCATSAPAPPAPCATCSESGPAPHVAAGPFPILGQKPLKPERAELVGRYALQIYWNDGHSTGIYSFPYLRESCLCAKCAGKRSGGEATPEAS